MAKIELLLKYQTEDSKLLQIEREAANSEECKNYSQTKSFLTKAPEKLEAMDAKAQEIYVRLDELNKKYGELADTLKDFDNIDELVEGGADISFYKKTISVQKQYTEFSAKYQEYKKGKLAEMDAVKEQLKVIAKDISPEVLKRYEMKRSERIFPIICTVKNNRCSKCGMELSIMGKEKIDGGEVTECENCHRFLYKE